MKKPSVLFILHLPPPVHGSSMVGKQIYDSLLINESVEGDYINLSTSRSVGEIGKVSCQKYIRALWVYGKVLGKLLRHRYDICYLAIAVTGWGLLRDFPLVLCAKMRAKKVVLHQHNKGVKTCREKPLYSWLYRRLYSRVKVILLSWYLYDEISEYVAKEDVFICPNGIKPLEPDEAGKR